MKYSIIIPHYNRPDLIVKTIESFKNLKDKEILIIDDVSTEENLNRLENNINKDSIEIDKDYIIYLWNIRNKQISGKLNKSGQDDMYFVDVFIEDTITRHIKDSVALSYQSRDI